MRVVLTADAVAVILADQAKSSKLHTLLGHARDGRHTVVVDPENALDGWLSTIDAASRNEYGRALQLCAREALLQGRDIATIKIAAGPVATWDDPLAELSLDLTLDVLAEPLGVLVENAENDFAFILSLMSLSQRESFRRKIEQRWIESLHGGGSDAIARLRARSARPAMKLRTYFMFDSDRLHPDECDPSWDGSSPDGSRVECQAFRWEPEVMQHLSGRYWRLHRRFIESYMPIDELQEENSTAAEAWGRLSDEQRWFYNMKDGFAKDLGRHDSARARDLYRDVTDEDRAALERGFGSKLAARFQKADNHCFNWDRAALTEARHQISQLLRLV